MIMLYCTVRANDIRMNSYSTAQKNEVKKAQKVAITGILYSGGNLLVWLPYMIFAFLDLRLMKEPSIFWILCLHIFTPLQGFVNALVYFKPRIADYLEKKRG